jgi:hypothetical protein
MISDQDYLAIIIFKLSNITKRYLKAYFTWGSIDMFEVLLTIDVPLPICTFVHHGLVYWETSPETINKWEIEPSGIFLISRLFRSSVDNQSKQKSLTSDFLEKISMITKKELSTNSCQLPDHIYNKHNQNVKMLAYHILNQTQYHPSLLNVPMSYLLQYGMECADTKTQEIQIHNEKVTQIKIVNQWKMYVKNSMQQHRKILLWLYCAREKIQSDNLEIAFGHLRKKTILKLQKNVKNRKQKKIERREKFLILKYGLFHWYDKMKTRKSLRGYAPFSKILEYIKLDRALIHLLSECLVLCFNHMSQFVESFEFWDQISSFDQLLAEVRELKRKSKPLVVINDLADGSTDKIFYHTPGHYARSSTSVSQFKTKQLKLGVSKSKVKKWADDSSKIPHNSKFLICEKEISDDHEFIKENLVEFVIVRIDMLFESPFRKTFRSMIVLMQRFHSIASCIELFDHFYKTLFRLKHNLLLFKTITLPSLLITRSEDIMKRMNFISQSVRLEWQTKFHIPPFNHGNFITIHDEDTLRNIVKTFLSTPHEQPRKQSLIQLLIDFTSMSEVSDKTQDIK